MTALPYKVICISIYEEDIEQLDAKITALKARGWTRANKSHLIRLALEQLDLDKVERDLRAAGMIKRKPIGELIAQSSIGHGLRDIKERGIDAHLVDLEQELDTLDKETA